MIQRSRLFPFARRRFSDVEVTIEIARPAKEFLVLIKPRRFARSSPYLVTGTFIAANGEKLERKSVSWKYSAALDAPYSTTSVEDVVSEGKLWISSPLKTLLPVTSVSISLVVWTRLALTPRAVVKWIGLAAVPPDASPVAGTQLYFKEVQ